MIRAIGTDLCDVARMERAATRTGERFLSKVFTPAERAACDGPGWQAALARRFAVKESTFKTLGRGWPHGVGFDEVELVVAPGAQDTVRLTGRAGEVARRLGLTRFVAATSDDGVLAVAVVIAE